jgi:hypothetical protein
MLTGKVWGTTELLLKNPLIEVHRLNIKPNSKCSLHCHNFKANGFYVASGTLYIETQKNDYDLVDVTELKAGGFTVVNPLEFHRFYTKEEGCIGIELYYPQVLEGPDIDRKDVGSTEG